MWLLPVTAALWAFAGYAVYQSPQAPLQWRGFSFGGDFPRRLGDTYGHKAWQCESPSFLDTCLDTAESDTEQVCGTWEAAPSETWINPSSPFGEEQQLKGKQYCCGLAYPSCAEPGDLSPCCPDYAFHLTAHSTLVASSAGLYASWITFFVLALVAACCAGIAFLTLGEMAGVVGLGACGCFLLVALTCLFVWIGVMRGYWEGAWGEWNPEVNFESPKDMNLIEYVKGVSPTSFQAKCWPPLGGRTCFPECRNRYFKFDAGKGIVANWQKWKMVDQDEPLRCMPPCDNGQLREILTKNELNFTEPDNSDRFEGYSQTGTHYKVECKGGLIRQDVNEKGVVRKDKTDTIECNPSKAGGLTGIWMVDMMCRNPKPCQAQEMDGDAPVEMAKDGSSGCEDDARCDSFKKPMNRKAFLKVGNSTCECWRQISKVLDKNEKLNDTAECLQAELGEAHTFFFKCQLPGGEHGERVKLECERAYHNTEDGKEAYAVCHDGKWKPGNTCVLQIRHFERAMIMIVFWLTVVGMPSCCCLCTLGAGVKSCSDGHRGGSVRWLGVGCCGGLCFWPLFGSVGFLLCVAATTLPLVFFVGLVLFVSVIMWHYEPFSTTKDQKEEKRPTCVEFLADFVVFPLLKWVALYLKWLTDLFFMIAGFQVYFPKEVIDIDGFNFPDLFPLPFVLPNFAIPGIPYFFRFITWLFSYFKKFNLAKWASLYCDAAMISLAALSMLNVAMVVALISMVDVFGLLAAVGRRAEVRKSTFRVRFCRFDIPPRAVAGVFQGMATSLKYAVSFSTQQMLLVGQRRIGDLYMLGAYGKCPVPEGALSKIYSQFLGFMVINCGFIIFLYTMNGHMGHTRLDLFFYKKTESIIRKYCRDPKSMGGEDKLLSGCVRQAYGDKHEAPESAPRQEGSSATAGIAQFWRTNVERLLVLIWNELRRPLRPSSGLKQFCRLCGRCRICSCCMQEDAPGKHGTDNESGGMFFPFSFLHFVPVTLGVWTEYQFEAFVSFDAKKFDIQETWKMMAKSRSEIVALGWQVVPAFGIVASKLTEYMNETIVVANVGKETLSKATYFERDITTDFYEEEPPRLKQRTVFVCKWAQWVMNVASYFNLFITMLGFVSAKFGMTLQFWVFGLKVLLSEVMSKVLRNDHDEAKKRGEAPQVPRSNSQVPPP